MRRHGIYGGAVIGASLLVGTAGFKLLAGQGILTAFTNAAMLLGGMGPVGDPDKYPAPGKLFAAFFALYAGLLLIAVAGLLLAPVFHRMLHKFHWEGRKE